MMMHGYFLSWANRFAERLVSWGTWAFKIRLYATAISFYEMALNIWGKLPQNRRSLRMILCLDSLGVVYMELKQYSKAKELLEEALRTSIAMRGENNFSMPKILNNLAAAYLTLGLLHDAETTLRKAQDLAKSIPRGGEEIPFDAILHNLGEACYLQAHLAEAEIFFSQAANLREQWPNDANPEQLFLTWQRLGQCYVALNRNDDALRIYTRAWQQGKARLGIPHPIMIEIGNNYAALLRSFNRENEALEIQGSIKQAVGRKK